MNILWTLWAIWVARFMALAQTRVWTRISGSCDAVALLIFALLFLSGEPDLIAPDSFSGLFYRGAKMAQIQDFSKKTIWFLEIWLE